MKTTNFSKFLALAFLASSLFLTSCGKDEVVPTPVVKEYAKVMLFHGATDAAAINLVVDGVTKNTDSLKYGNVTAYNQVELTGKRIPIGATYAKSGTKIGLVDSALMNKNVGYSYFVYQENDAAKTVAVIKAVDDLTLPAAGKGRIRLVHLVPDAQVDIDVQLVAPGGVATTVSNFTKVKFKDILNFIDVAAGTYDVKVKLTGTVQVLFSATNLVIADGKLYTYVARGYANAIAPRGAVITVVNNN